MKNLRNIYLILGVAAIVFAILTKHIPGITVTDFVQGFCYGLGLTLLVAGLVTSTIPYLYRTRKGEKKEPAQPEPGDPTIN
jgi:formate/nitrite transporter FocA (FNT family)